MNSLSGRWYLPFLAASLALGALSWSEGPSDPAQTKRPTRKKSSSPSKPQPAAIAAEAQFQTGETLAYRVMWTRFLLHAANIDLAVRERRPFYGREAWHFRAVARTIDAMRLLYALDDQFDAYVEPSSLATLQFEMYLREQDKRQDSLLRFQNEKDAGAGTGTGVHVVPGTLDPVGYLYFLRATDWKATPQKTTPVYDGRKLYEVRASREIERGTVSVPAGKFIAQQIAIRVYEREKEVDQTRFWVWLALDEARTPVLIETEVPFGTGRVELVRVQKGS